MQEQEHEIDPNTHITRDGFLKAEMYQELAMNKNKRIPANTPRHCWTDDEQRWQFEAMAMVSQDEMESTLTWI